MPQKICWPTRGGWYPLRQTGIGVSEIVQEELPHEKSGRASHRRSVALLIYLLALVPPVVMFTSVSLHAVNVPLWDEWEFPLLMTRLEAGELSVPALAWTQRGEHRKVFPHLVILGLAYLTDFNVVAHIYFAAALRVLSLVLLWRLLVATIGPAQGAVTAPLTVLASGLLWRTTLMT